jgi:hypothetical protein
MKHKLLFVAALAASGCSGELDPPPPEEATTAEALTASQSDVDVRIYEDTLTRYITNLDRSGTQNGWVWSVRAPEVEMTTSGIRLKGTLSARQALRLTFPFQPITTPRPTYVASFDVPASLSYVNNKLQFSVSSTPVTVTRIHNGQTQTLASVNLEPLYETSLPITNMAVSVSGTPIELDADQVEIVHYNGYAHVLATFDVY